MIKANLPQKLPVKVDKAIFAEELGNAALELGRLDGLHRNLPNPDILIAPLLSTTEAAVSSKIEGTISTVANVLRFEATGEPTNNDTREVSNYKRAMQHAVDGLKQRPLNISFIKTLHQILLENTRGHEERGDFRKKQVWIGKEGTPIEEATYIPPDSILVAEYMDNLEQFILTNNLHPLIKIGIIHYHFEAIHPFPDGNGRIGRLIIPLYLYWKKLITKPIFYISGYFDKNRDEYMSHLHSVDLTNKYEDWLKFFLISVQVQAKETQDIINNIYKLKKEIDKLTEKIKSPYAYKVVNFIFSNPFFISADAIKKLEIEPRTSRRLFLSFEEINIIKEIRSFKKKGKAYVFPKLMRLISY
ncbi:MAG: Fic family protein [Candidatus Latescibacteria bacterium]|nr:Fic family protein [Candidatus Latescibacterota bacterium]